MNKLKTIALRGLLVLSMAGLFIWTPANAADAPEITVYKSPTCSCCEKWVQHLRDNGFKAFSSVVHPDRP